MGHFEEAEAEEQVWAQENHGQEEHVIACFLQEQKIPERV